MEAVLDLDFQDASAPSVGKGFGDAKLAVGGVLNALNDLEDMAPRQLRNRLLRNWRIGKLASEYFIASRLRVERPCMVGKALRRSAERRSMTLAP